MRLRTYTAPTTTEAMALVRRDMGDNAIIVSTRIDEDDQLCWISAAIEDDDLPITDAANQASAGEDEPEMDPQTRRQYLRQVLMAHGLPEHILEQLLRDTDLVSEADPALALAAAIDLGIAFKPIDVRQQRRPLLLSGIPGAGKTITSAKLCAHARFAGRSVFVASCDTKRAGGVEQLRAFTDILGLELLSADSADTLAGHLDAIRHADIAIIDTPGVNPFDPDDMSLLRGLAEAVDGEIVLVMAAGADAMESAETARAFAEIGANRMIISRLDLTRRLGGILAPALIGRIAIANVSVNPQVADGLSQINPVSLAHLIIPDDDPYEHTQQKVAQ